MLSNRIRSNSLKTKNRRLGYSTIFRGIIDGLFRVSNFKFPFSESQKGCQPKPGVLRCKAFKTNIGRTKRVSIFCNVYFGLERHRRCRAPSYLRVKRPRRYIRITKPLRPLCAGIHGKLGYQARAAGRGAVLTSVICFTSIVAGLGDAGWRVAAIAECCRAGARRIIIT